MSEATPPRAALRKLPVIETAKEAYTRVFGNPRLLVRASLVPFCLSLALIALGLSVPVVSALGYLFAFLALLTAGAPPLLPSWKQRHWRFLGYLLAVMLIGSGATAVVVSLGLAVLQPESDTFRAGLGLMPIAGFAILAYVMARLSFVFPAVSVDEDYRLRHAWTHTKGQGLRLIGATVLAAVPMVALVWVVSSILGALLFAEPAAAPGQSDLPTGASMAAFVDANRGALLLIQTITAAINYALMALMVSVISIAFEDLRG
jgi:hypothetical protein